MINRIRVANGYIAISRNRTNQAIRNGMLGIIFAGFSFFEFSFLNKSILLIVHASVFGATGVLLFFLSGLGFIQKPSKKDDILRLYNDRIEHIFGKIEDLLIYNWEEISKIIIASKCTWKRPIKVSYTKNVLVVLFNHKFDDTFYERNKFQRHIAADGNSYIILKIPAKDTNLAFQNRLVNQNDLNKFCKCNELIFDYVNGDVLFFDSKR